MENWTVSYKKEWLRPDVIAGVTTAAVVIPKAMAYATIAGLPVQVGLYTAFLPMVIYAVLGTSRVLSVSTTTTLAILAAAQLGEVVPAGDAALAVGCLGHADTVGWSDARACFRPAAGLRCQFHLRAGLDWLQGRHRVSHRAGPAPEDPRHPFCEGNVRPEPAGDRSTASRYFTDHLAVGIFMIVLLVGVRATLHRKRRHR